MYISYVLINLQSFHSGWIYDATGDHNTVMQTACAISSIAVFLVACRLYYTRCSDEDNLSINVSEDLVNDVFIDDDRQSRQTNTTLVFLTEHDMQYVTVV